MRNFPFIFLQGSNLSALPFRQMQVHMHTDKNIICQEQLNLPRRMPKYDPGNFLSQLQNKSTTLPKRHTIEFVVVAKKSAKCNQRLSRQSPTGGPHFHQPVDEKVTEPKFCFSRTSTCKHNERAYEVNNSLHSYLN